MRRGAGTPLAAPGVMEVVLITGCDGFLGRATAQALAREYTVVGLDHDAPPGIGPLAEFVPIDLASDSSVREALEHVRGVHGPRIASVIHLAAYYDFSGEPSPAYDAVTVRGTERLLRALAPFDVEQFVYASTMLVHAPTTPGAPITEHFPIDPTWDYPKSKWEAEKVILQYGLAQRPVILRIAGVYDDDCHSPTLANQIQRIYERRMVSHLFPGDTSHGQTFVHLDDVVDAFQRVLESRARLASGEIMLIGETGTVSYDELQRTLAELIHGEEWTTTTIPKAIAKAGAWVEEHVPGEDPFIKPWMIDRADDHFELDTTHARRTIGWEPRRDLRTSLRVMVENLQSDPARFYRENELELPGWLKQTTNAERGEQRSYAG
jgi:nucleoside-diphosphate-sugar epimerase